MELYGSVVFIPYQAKSSISTNKELARDDPDYDDIYGESSSQAEFKMFI